MKCKNLWPASVDAVHWAGPESRGCLVEWWKNIPVSSTLHIEGSFAEVRSAGWVLARAAPGDWLVCGGERVHGMTNKQFLSVYEVAGE